MKSLNDKEKEIAFRVLDSVLDELKREEKNWKECEKRKSDEGEHNQASIARSVANGIGFSINHIEYSKELIKELGVV